MGDKMTGHGQSMFDKSGAVGSMFNGKEAPRTTAAIERHQN